MGFNKEVKVVTRTIPSKESFVVEFKSDKKPLPDHELVATVVCLANSEGGEIYLGVENNGSITGLNPNHQDAAGMAALIANRTRPSINVRINLIEEDGKFIACVNVPKSTKLVATIDGLIQRRNQKIDGTPECIPLDPSEIESRQGDLGLLDYSARLISGATEADFDPLEQERLRQLIDTYQGDPTLRNLSDAELNGALGLVRTNKGGIRIPTVTGLLIIGREQAIRDHIPTHEVAFQVRDDTQVRVNDFYRGPLLKVFERVREQFEARIEQDEVQVGFMRAPLPSYDGVAFREAFVNALTHRDYTRLGTVFVRMDSDGLTISNPGSFVEGVTLENILIVEPKPRNPTLADAMKRIGLAERTGRGVDLIYARSLRYGKPEPDYSRSTSNTIVVYMDNSTKDIPFYRLILQEEERTKKTMPLDSLIIMARLRKERRIDLSTAAKATQKNLSDARSTLERLVEADLVEPRGLTRDKIYILSPRVYRALDIPSEYVRQAGFASIQNEQMILQYIRQHGKIQARDVVDLCRINRNKASYLLSRMRLAGKIHLAGMGSAIHYVTEVSAEGETSLNTIDGSRNDKGLNNLTKSSEKFAKQPPLFDDRTTTDSS